MNAFLRGVFGVFCFCSFLALFVERRYAEERDDRLHMESFYDNYCNPQTVAGRRNYPVVCVNYHKLWDNKEALVKALGLPAGEALKVTLERQERAGRGGGACSFVACLSNFTIVHGPLSRRSAHRVYSYSRHLPQLGDHYYGGP